MRARLFVAAGSALAIGLGVFACTTDNGNQPIPVFNPDSSIIYFDATAADASADADGSTSANDATADAADAADSSQGDAGFSLNGCNAAAFADADYTAPDASRLIRFPLADGGLAYDPQCMHVKAGEKVTWSGDFEMHPLGPQGGDPNNPIPNGVFDAGPDGALTIDFAEAGTFGYACQVHSHMVGAIEVTP